MVTKYKVSNKKLIALFLLEAVFLIVALNYLVSGQGADRTVIKKQEMRCRAIGIDVASNEPITSCFYGIKVDTTRIDATGNEVTNERILAFEEIYIGGTYEDGKYQEDGYFVGKYRKDFFYNDNADVFWKVEVGLNGSTLEYCSMRDQEYADTSRTKEECQSLYIDII
ncbi:hypothetical protein A3K73_09055 [Candidatus Pacearchaeota archaeon RBG_13_36_9]|nr:MAG: hypothetical protein A3K73_09055 [Candidatus Pacearchaeota archaeon RBG_13_36_9]